jgi:hypothetical protein
MESVKRSLCPMCDQCPEVEIAGDEVRIGEPGNLTTLKKDKWNGVGHPRLVRLVGRQSHPQAISTHSDRPHIEPVVARRAFSSSKQVRHVGHHEVLAKQKRALHQQRRLIVQNVLPPPTR